MGEHREAARYSAPALALLVFAAGGGLMCMEIVGGMTVAPYFGSNVFVWGSVIAVFMGALSLGYVLGGRMADRAVGPAGLAALVLMAGVLMILAPWLGPMACGALLGADLGPRLNRFLPLAAVTLVYFLPSMLLGMTSPMAVRIGSTAVKSVGSSVGGLYALSTLGSVVGALLSTFVLVVFFGNQAILIGCGVVLVLAALAYGHFHGGGGPETGRWPGGREAGEAERVPGLRPLVFGCGMVLMSLEVVGGAEIAPYFGSSVFVWGSVITVFLGALSVGYRVGGKLADRRPSLMTLATLVVAAGIATLLVPFIAPAVCTFLLRTSFGVPTRVIGPLFASLLLYFIPITLFAMVAPFAVRLSTRRLRSVGGIAGTLYALSTLGNVVGVLLTTFVLISAVGKTHVLTGAGFVAVLAAVAAVLLHTRGRTRAEGVRPRQPVVISAALLLAVAALAFWAKKPPLVPLVDKDERVLGRVGAAAEGWHLVEYRGADEYGEEIMVRLLRRIRAERESAYHHIAVVEQRTLPLGRSVETADGKSFVVEHTTPTGDRRELKFDQYIESGVRYDFEADRIRTPYKSSTTYSDLLHLPFVLKTDIQKVAIIGGGGGVVPMMYRKAYTDPQVTIDVVEIDPVVADVARTWFGLEEDEHLRMHVQDGRMFIHNSPDRYDLIILDAYTAGGRIPFHLTTQEFLTELRGHVGENGLVLMNVISAVEGPASKLFRSEYKTFQAVFGAEHVYVFPKIRYTGLNAGISTNVILIATGPAHRRRLTLDDVVALAEELAGPSGKIKMPSLPRFAGNMLTRSELADVRQDDVHVLTDDHAPVDMMAVEREDR